MIFSRGFPSPPAVSGNDVTGLSVRDANPQEEFKIQNAKFKIDFSARHSTFLSVSEKMIGISRGKGQLSQARKTNRIDEFSEKGQAINFR